MRDRDRRITEAYGQELFSDLGMHVPVCTNLHSHTSINK